MRVVKIYALIGSTFRSLFLVQCHSPLAEAQPAHDFPMPVQQWGQVMVPACNCRR
jgi:hypothetical protein